MSGWPDLLILKSGQIPGGSQEWAPGQTAHLPPSGTRGPRLSPPRSGSSVPLLHTQSEHKARRKHSGEHTVRAALYFFILKHVCESIQARDWHETSVTLTRLASLQPTAQCASCARPSRTFRNTETRRPPRDTAQNPPSAVLRVNYRFSSHSLFSRRVR